jgi:thiol-disulfide isomerase/thioredoxin
VRRFLALFLVLFHLAAEVVLPGSASARAGVRFYDKGFSHYHRDVAERSGEPRPPGEDRTRSPSSRAQGPRRRSPSAPTPVHDGEYVYDPASGALVPHRPPAPVAAFLEHPTEENAERYLDWQEARTRKAVRAMEVLERVAARRRAARRVQAPPSSGDSPLVVAFLTPDCPHCVHQALALNMLLRDRSVPGLRIQAVLRGGGREVSRFVRTYRLVFPVVPDRGEAARLGVSTWPTTFVFPPGGGPVLRLRGLATVKDLTRALARAGSRREPNPPTRPGRLR